MEINVNDNRKLVDIWLTRADQRDEALLHSLRPLYQRYKSQKYLVAVFRSGEEDLCGLTQPLLRANRRRSAQLEVEREKREQAAEWSRR